MKGGNRRRSSVASSKSSGNGHPRPAASARRQVLGHRGTAQAQTLGDLPIGEPTLKMKSQDIADLPHG